MKRPPDSQPASPARRRVFVILAIVALLIPDSYGGTSELASAGPPYVDVSSLGMETLLAQILSARLLVRPDILAIHSPGGCVTLVASRLRGCISFACGRVSHGRGTISPGIGAAWP